MRVGIVCPYAVDVPGGVQFHVRDLAEYLLAAGHHVSVLAPADDDTPLPPYVESAGKAVPVPYNGSVARLLFGPVTAARVSRWIERGEFDVVHVHEPISPSLSMLAMWACEGPLVATFHTSNARSRTLSTLQPLMQSGLEKIRGRIAVSEAARRFLLSHIDMDCTVIPNGVYVDDFARAHVTPAWAGTPQRPTIAFLGRIEEPRKGIAVLLAALPEVLRVWPGLRVLIAGPGDPREVMSGQPDQVKQACEFLGPVTDEQKASMLHSVDAYIAPNTGGESFGIILIEAMSAGAPVIASDIEAFDAVLRGGACGALFANEDAGSLAAQIQRVLGDADLRARLRASGLQRAREFDWSRVATEIINVYETVLAAEPRPVMMEETAPSTTRRGRRLSAVRQFRRLTGGD
ncbi:glycosyltransferase family 4 protein [Branchiibius cervicis]|uniref:D-inositol 3-phosphate glycosyltransferase n=1 Tax=Branchiibius cervicis TaxID=908252 RepID=A0ABW2ARE5_9MICO